MYRDNQLGFWSGLVGAASSLFGGSSGPGGSGGGSNIAVSPNISTQVSPQISPVFQQQFQPQNSAATAGTSMVGAPTAAGGEAAAPYGAPLPAGGLPVPQPARARDQAEWARYMPYALAGLGILALVSVSKKRKKSA